MTKQIQPSFAAGEVSPAIGARVDLSKRQVAVETAENFVATFTGSMRSRPGQRFVAQCKPGAGPYRILDFEFSVTQTFVLELGDFYMRFHTLGAQVLDSNNIKTITGVTTGAGVVTSAAHGLSDGDEVFISGIVGMTELNGRNFIVDNAAANTFTLTDLNGTAITTTQTYTSGGTATPPYEIVTPWPASVLFELSYAQSGDVFTVCHPDYPPQELVRVENDVWTLSEITFLPEERAPANTDVVVNTEILATTITAATQANPVVVTAAGHGYESGDRVLIEGVVGMVELNNFIYTVTVLSANTFSIQYNDGDPVDGTGFGAYVSDGVTTLSVRLRLYSVTAVNEDDSEESLRSLGVRALTISSITQADPCVVTTTGGHGLDSLDDIEIKDVVGMTELNGQRFTAVFIDATSFSLRRFDNTDVDSTVFGAYVSGGTCNPLYARAVSSADTDWNNTVYWDASVNTQFYKVYATDNLGILGFIGNTTKLTFEDRFIEPDFSDSPQILYNPFDSFVSGTNKYPAAVGYFQQRRIFANSNNFPNRFWMSQTGHFNNLSRSIPPNATDSIVASIAARRINAIQHIVPLTDLVFLTSGGEYRAFSQESGVITPATLNVKPQSFYGCTGVRPVVVGDLAVYVSAGEFVRSLKYEFADDSFMGQDLSLLARHLFDYRLITDWDYSPAPYNVMLATMSDGGAVYLTFQPDQDVYAWSRSTTKGKYKSTCSIREGDNDIIYVVVERTINGNVVSFVERIDEHQFTELSDAFCVDAGLSLDIPITITGATSANPVVITAVGHGLTDGDTVDISDIKTLDTSVNEGESLDTDFNGTGYTVANATADTFELQIEGVDYDGTAFATYSSGGAAREAVTTISGLWHLEGETVVAAGNGYAEKDLVVTNGSITLTAPASRIHIGLSYFARLVTLPISMYASKTETTGRAKNINRLTVQVERAMGMWFGPTLDQMREAKFGLPAQYGQPLVMVEDDIDVTMKADWAKRKQTVIEQRDPLPLTILSLVPDASLGGN